MSNGNGQMEGGVALLVDFENLVLCGGGRAEVDCGALLTLAAGFGPLRGANLYADWRAKTMRRYPDRLCEFDVEFVLVLGRRRGRVLKNAVDIRMAVDAVELVHAMPDIDVYVVVTGDRDFVCMVQALQRRGKTVVGVAPLDGASGELVGQCDRFVYYESTRGAPRRPWAADGRGAYARWRGAARRRRGRLRVLGFRAELGR